MNALLKKVWTNSPAKAAGPEISCRDLLALSSDALQQIELADKLTLRLTMR